MLKKRALVTLLGAAMAASLLAGCGKEKEAQAPVEGEAASGETAGGGNNDFKGEELSILTSEDWMNNRYDEVIANFEEEYGVTVDLQTIPAGQYNDVLQSKLKTDACTDIFWIQSNPFAISSQIVDPDKYCIDFTGAKWQSVMPENRQQSCMYQDKLYGLQIWNGSPEYVMLYNKTLFEENNLKAPTTYEELVKVCETLTANDITPWFMPGADGWQHQLIFFQIGGVYEKNEPGLYEKLNNNEATFKDNKTMLTVLEQFKELSDKGYLGEDWIGTDSTNMVNEIAERNYGMTVANAGDIKQIQEETGLGDELGLFLLPLADNDCFPTSPAGPTMFGYKGSTHPELVKAFFDYVSTTESLQSILDSAPEITNLDVTDENVEQHWLPEEEEFMEGLTDEQKATVVIQNGTKYTNDYWTQFGQDMVAYCQGQMEANDVLANMDANRAEAAKVAEDPAWK